MTLSLRDALVRGPVVLDGGLSTELEAGGHDVSSALWSARLLRDDPAAIVRAHRAFFAAGARVATTASYQASFAGFAAAGIGATEAAGLMTRSVTLAREAANEVDGPAWVAASVGPFGATLADGSEYTGSYAATMTVAELRAFHRPRLEVLAAAGADVLACETIPAAAEVEAMVAELDRLDMPAWISLTAQLDADGTVRTRRGESASEVFALAASCDAVLAVGVNCLDPHDSVAAVRVAATASNTTVLVYPNSGERWDADSRCWYGTSALDAGLVEGWLAGGAGLIGGCCRVGPAEIAAIVAALAECGTTS